MLSNDCGLYPKMKCITAKNVIIHKNIDCITWRKESIRRKRYIDDVMY